LRRHSPSYAYASRGKNCARRIILLKLTTDRHDASCGLSVTARLFVLHYFPVALSTGSQGFSSVVSNLGVLFDAQLSRPYSMADHVTSVCKSCFFQLRQLRLICSCLTTDAAKTLIHAFVSSRLDYCNSLLVGVADCVIRKLQGVQNAAARMITGTRKFDHVTPILRELHWLPVAQRIQYKTAMLVNKCLRGLAPPYLAEVKHDDCQI